MNDNGEQKCRNALMMDESRAHKILFTIVRVFFSPARTKKMNIIVSHHTDSINKTHHHPVETTKKTMCFFFTIDRVMSKTSYEASNAIGDAVSIPGDLQQFAIWTIWI